MVLKSKPKLNFKIMLKESKTIIIIKGSKNRTGLTQEKAISKQEIWYIKITRKSTLKNIVYDCTFWALYWYINSKINWERIFKRLHKWAIYFWDSVKKFARSHHSWSAKKMFLKILQYSQENTYVGVFFNKVAGLQVFYRAPPGDYFSKHSRVMTKLFFVRRITKQLHWRLT